jgi:Predicted membrane metal-binding protein
MIEERDIAGIGVPFAAGVATGFLLFQSLDASSIHLPVLTVFLLTVTAALLLSACSRADSSIFTLQISIASMFLCAGVFCAGSDLLSSTIPSTVTSIPERLAFEASSRLKRLIMSIPFKSETTAPLLQALLTGDRSMLDKATVSAFRNAGASHILALSGLHLGMIYLIMTRLFSPLGNSIPARRLRYILTVGASFFYCMMTGAGPSIVRAFLFIFIGETAKLLGREKDPVRILLASLTIQLAVKPASIATLGFQLSYLAMTGIFIIYPRLEHLYPGSQESSRFDPFQRIWKSAMLSLSCQVFTAPLVWYRFHTFPQYFLITNMIALPLTSVIMVLSVATITLSFLGICPVFLSDLDNQAVQALVTCLEIISAPDVS